MPEFKGTKYEGGYPTREYEKFMEDNNDCYLAIADQNTLPISMLREEPSFDFDEKGHHMRITLYEREGPTPHIHVFMGTDSKAPVACVKLESAEYFPHGKKDRFSTLSSFYKKMLDYELSKTITEPNGAKMTLWKHLCKAWNKSAHGVSSTGASTMQLINIANTVKPDYTKITEGIKKG